MDAESPAPEEIAQEPDQSHKLESGPIYNQHPDETIGQLSQDMLAKAKEKDKELAVFLEGTPNLNDHYAGELAAVADQFAQDGLTIAPITVLSEDDYANLADIVGGSPEEGGRFINGHTLVKEDSEAIRTFGSAAITRMALHEAAHSTQGETKYVVVSQEVKASGSAEEVPPKRYVTLVDGLGGFHKYKRTNPEINENLAAEMIGDFLEEGFADLTRVRYSEQLGVSSNVDGRASGLTLSDGTRVRYAGHGVEAPLIDTEQNCITLPMEYAMSAMPVGEDQVATQAEAPNIAAYGLTLLDERAPGLYKAMQASRTDPKAYSQVVQMIEGVKPGLYRELSLLQYNAQDFDKGLRAIVSALAS